VNLEDCRFVSEAYFRALDPARSPKRGDVLYSVTGSFGLAVLVDVDAKFCVQRHMAILRPSPGVTATYLVRALSSNAVFRAASAIATGTAQKTVPLTGLRKLAVPLPPGAEQQRIAAEVDRRFTLLSAFETSTSTNQTRASALRQSLLVAAFEGKLVPPSGPSRDPQKTLRFADPAQTKPQTVPALSAHSSARPL
jgi:type I restriction enzyme, S subunit